MKFENLEDFFAKMDWEGGPCGFVNYGGSSVRINDMPSESEKITEAFQDLEDAQDKVAALLDEIRDDHGIEDF